MLEEKMRKFKPEAVAIIGKQIWEALWLAKTGTKLKAPQFKWGWQDEDAWLGRTLDDDGKVTWQGARTFVTTSTSGLSASLKPHEKLEIWKPLGDWFTARRKEVAESKEQDE
jgi:thymine-DNA glycosylase